MNNRDYDTHERLKSTLVAALNLRQDRAWAWDHLLAKVRELRRKAGCAFRKKLRAVLGAEDTGSNALLEAARLLKSRAESVNTVITGFPPDSGITVNGVRYVREDDAVAVRPDSAVDRQGRLLPCPRCRKVPNVVATRPVNVEVPGGTLCMDLYECPRCHAPVGASFGGNNAFWTWNRLVELAPDRAPDVFKAPAVARDKAPKDVKDLLGQSEEAQRYFNARIIEAYRRGQDSETIEPRPLSHLVRGGETLCGLKAWESGNVDITFGVSSGTANCARCLRAIAMEWSTAPPLPPPYYVHVDEEMRLRSSVALSGNSWELCSPPANLARQLRAAWLKAGTDGLGRTLKVTPTKRGALRGGWEWGVEVL